MTDPAQSSEEGFATAQYVVAVALSLVFLVMLVNVVVFQYGRGVVQAAADEGARAGAPIGADASTCRTRASEVLDAGLAESMRAGTTLRCTVNGAWVESVATATFPAWMPMIPDWSFEVHSRSLRQERVAAP